MPSSGLETPPVSLLISVAQVWFMGKTSTLCHVRLGAGQPAQSPSPAAPFYQI